VCFIITTIERAAFEFKFFGKSSKEKRVRRDLSLVRAVYNKRRESKRITNVWCKDSFLHLKTKKKSDRGSFDIFFY
jgi:hypothetical protein